MKHILTLLLVFSAVVSFGQKVTNPKDPRNNPQKDTVIYLTPEGQVFVTLQVYAIIVDIKQPLLVQEFSLITKSWVYKGGKKVADSQWLEKIIEDKSTKVVNWKKRTLFMIRKDEYDKE